MLIKSDAFIATRIVTGSRVAVFHQNALSVLAVIVIMIHIPVRLILFCSRMIWRYFCHCHIPLVSFCGGSFGAAFRSSLLRFGCRKDMSHEIHKPLARRVSRHFRKLHLFFRHCPLPWRGLASRRRDCTFSGQLLVCQPPPERRTRRFDETRAIVTLPFVVSERLLIKVAEKMKRFDADIGSFQTALEQRPEILDTVGMHVSFDVP